MKVNTIEAPISKALTDSNISHDKLVSIDNMLKEYGEMKQEIKNFKIEWIFIVSNVCLQKLKVLQ